MGIKKIKELQLLVEAKVSKFLVSTERDVYSFPLKQKAVLRDLD